MKNRKQLLADFYLELLAQEPAFKLNHSDLIAQVCLSIAYELEEKSEVIERIFERMAAEDVVPTKIVCCECGEAVVSLAKHNCRNRNENF